MWASQKVCHVLLSFYSWSLKYKKKQGNETRTMFIGHFSVCMSRVSQRKLCHFFISKRAAVHVYNSTLQDCPTMAGGQLSKRALWSSTSFITGHSRCFWVRFSDKWNGHDNFWSKMKHGHGAESSNSEFILADTMYLMTWSFGQRTWRQLQVAKKFRVIIYPLVI